MKGSTPVIGCSPFTSVRHNSLSGRAQSKPVFLEARLQRGGLPPLPRPSVNRFSSLLFSSLLFGYGLFEAKSRSFISFLNTYDLPSLNQKIAVACDFFESFFTMSSTELESAAGSSESDGFVQVKSRKRKSKESGMDLEGSEQAAKKKPLFPPISAEALVDSVEGFRKVPVPNNRYTPLKQNWEKLYTPIVEHLKLQIRFNLKTRNVELRTCEETDNIGSLQKAADFVRAFLLGFEVSDALSLVRLEDLFLESFRVTDVKPLKGDHLSRAIGRIAGAHGKTKFTIENVCKVRIVLADEQVHILGSYQNIRSARHSISSLILGSPPSKVYGSMRAYASRAAARF